MHLRKAIKNMYINPSAAILLRYLQFTSQSWCYVEYDINTKTNNTVKYEHDNHNTSHYGTQNDLWSEHWAAKTANEQTANAKSKSKQQQHTAKLDERMKFKQCCQRQIQIYI